MQTGAAQFVAAERRIAEQSKRLSTLEESLRDLERGTESVDSADIAQLEEDNRRLEYRRKILAKSVADMEKKAPKKETPNVRNASWAMAALVDTEACTLLTEIRVAFEAVVGELYPQYTQPIVIVEASKPSFGDYQCNNAMAIAKMLSAAGEKTNPRQVAEKILSRIGSLELVEKMEVAGAGFINVFLSGATVAARLRSVVTAGVRLPRLQRRRVIVDFSSPNIAKQMHVGHLRSTIIGDSVSRLLERFGLDVLRLNHIGDWGTQFGMLIAHLKDCFPSYLDETPPIADLQAFYKESKLRFDQDEAFKARAYECVVQLQKYDADHTKAWQRICDVSRRDYEELYARLDVRITDRGESFYNELMPAVVSELEGLGLVSKQDGRQLVFAEGCDVPMTVVKSDGGFTYDTSDLAAVKQRLVDEKADWILYVIDSGQGMHMNQQLFPIARQAGWYDPAEKRLEHVNFGLVLGEDRKKLKTRSGDSIKLIGLLDEGLKRAAAKLEEKGRSEEMTAEELDKAQKAVAYGCIKYADLSHNRHQDYVFSFDRMLDDRGNTAVYLLYAYTRIRSIGRTAGVERARLDEWCAANELLLDDPRELKLAKHILKLSDCLLGVLDSLQMHALCEYMYELATCFSEFYRECYCVEKDADGNIKKIHYSRLALCEAAADVMHIGFAILGISTVEKM